MADCKKRPYLSEWDAIAALRAIRRKSDGAAGRQVRGAYFCPACRVWHLTSKSKTRRPPWKKPRGQVVSNSARSAPSRTQPMAADRTLR